MLRKTLMLLPILLASDYVSAGAMAGGASEPTQIANNIELMMGLAESARQTSVQMNQLHTQLKNVQGMGGLGAIENQMGLPSGSLSKAAEAAGSIKNLRYTINGISVDSESLSDRAKLLQATYRGALKIYEKTGKLPSEVLEDVPNMKREEAQVYKEIASNTNKQIDGVVKDMDSINRQSQGISSITGNVKGLQFIAAQNVEINRSLKETNATLLQSMSQEAELKAAELNQEAIEVENQAARDKAAHTMFKKTTVINNDVWTELMKSQEK